MHRFHHHRHCGVTSPFYKQTSHAKIIFEWDSWSSRDFLCELIGCWQHDNARTDFCVHTCSCSISVMAWFYSTSFEKRNQNMVQTMNQNIVVYYAFLLMINIALITQAWPFLCFMLYLDISLKYLYWVKWAIKKFNLSNANTSFRSMWILNVWNFIFNTKCIEFAIRPFSYAFVV